MLRRKTTKHRRLMETARNDMQEGVTEGGRDDRERAICREEEEEEEENRKVHGFYGGRKVS